MSFKEGLIKTLNQADDEYEIIAVCYWKLLRYKKDTDIIFITRIGHLSEDYEYGTYAELFEDLRQYVLDIAQQMNMRDGHAGTGFEEFRDKLIKKLSEFNYPKSLAESTCISICLFYILEALDNYVEKNLDQVYDTCKSCGPLNKGSSREHCSVYLQERASFLSGAYDSENAFRKPLRSMRIGAMFHAFLLIANNDLKNIPQIIPIQLKKSCKRIIEEKKIVISSVPYIGFNTFRFCSVNDKNLIKTNKIEGPFFVEYIPELEDDNIQRIIALLDLAIQHETNIIVFPEFIMSKKMKDAIHSYLSGIKYDDKKELLLVFAGTNYHWDKKKNKGNNVLHIFNANGMEIGTYYKYSPFLIQTEERVHGADISSISEDNLPKRRQYCKNCEILSEPGEKCVLLDISGVGRILPAICRDVIDGELTYHLANLFMPSFLVIPAWSKSVNSFDTRLISLADTVHVASLLCNCCNAVESEKEIIGRFYLPAKQGTCMNANILNILRGVGCQNMCQERGGCIVQIEVDFSCGQPKSKIIDTFFPQIKNKI